MAYSKSRNHRTIYSIAIALSRGIAPTIGHYHTLQRQIARFYLLLRSIALPETCLSLSFCTRLSATCRIIAMSPQYASITRLGRGVPFWRVALYKYGLNRSVTSKPDYRGAIDDKTGGPKDFSFNFSFLWPLLNIFGL
jgi:hypothetical protein